MSRRPLSPIERMIDTATGFNQFKDACHALERTPFIECPICNARKPTWQHPSDPKGTVIVIACCPKCDDGRAVLFADKSGALL